VPFRLTRHRAKDGDRGGRISRAAPDLRLQE
jgi:hypothetical protein